MQFLPEQIELLWIIPVVALVAFIFIIQLVSQKREQSDLSREVAQFNTGAAPIAQPPASMGQGSDRLNQLERAISTITDSLTAQQQTLNQVSKGNVTYSSEIGDLKTKLRELYKEYDIVLSENYSLRAKVKKLQEGQPDNVLPATVQNSPKNQTASGPRDRVDVLLSSKVDMRLYEDTRTLNVALLDDTSEIDLSELTHRSET